MHLSIFFVLSTKPLPFLRRSVYNCAWGSRTGQPYLPEIDFFPGAVLFVHYMDRSSASEPLRKYLEHTQGILRIYITGVDQTSKRKAL